MTGAEPGPPYVHTLGATPIRRRVLHYAGDVTGIVGQVVGPTQPLGEMLVITDTTYDEAEGRTTATLRPAYVDDVHAARESTGVQITPHDRAYHALFEALR